MQLAQPVVAEMALLIALFRWELVWLDWGQQSKLDMQQFSHLGNGAPAPLMASRQQDRWGENRCSDRATNKLSLLSPFVRQFSSGVVPRGDVRRRWCSSPVYIRHQSIMGLVLMYDLFFPLCYFAMTERRREWPRGTLRGGGGGGAWL